MQRAWTRPVEVSLRSVALSRHFRVCGMEPHRGANIVVPQSHREPFNPRFASAGTDPRPSVSLHASDPLRTEC